MQAVGASRHGRNGVARTIVPASRQAPHVPMACRRVDASTQWHMELFRQAHPTRMDGMDTYQYRRVRRVVGMQDMQGNDVWRSMHRVYSRYDKHDSIDGYMVLG